MKKHASEIGRRVAFARGLVGLSARELDRLAGITEGHTSLVESVVDNVSTQTVVKLAGVLGVSLDWLISGIGRPPTARSIHSSVGAARAQHGSAA